MVQLAVENSGSAAAAPDVARAVTTVQVGEKLIERALALLSSTDPIEVLAGCDTVRALGDRVLLPTLAELEGLWADDPHVVAYVQATSRDIARASIG
jgi:hypothetical protein